MNKLASFISMIKPSRKIIFGQDYLEQYNVGRIKLIVLISDAGDKTRDRVIRFGAVYKINVIQIDKKILGEEYASSRLAVFSCIDENVSKKLINLMKEGATYE